MKAPVLFGRMPHIVGIILTAPAFRRGFFIEGKVDGNGALKGKKPSEIN
jgi:hypothetical protein